MSKVKATIYNIKTGEIIMSLEAPDEEAVTLQPLEDGSGIYWEDALDHNTWYFVNRRPVPRPTMKLHVTPGTDLAAGQELLIRNIPAGCMVTHPAGVTRVDDGYISWSSHSSGAYSFEFKLFPYQTENLNASIR